MSNHRVFVPTSVALFGILMLAGAGCQTSGRVPQFLHRRHGPRALPASVAGPHTIRIDNMGGVSAGDTCVAISRAKNHSVQWVPEAAGHNVSIVFLLERPAGAV